MSEATPPFDPDDAPMIPAEIAILPLFHVVVYPETVVPLAVGQALSVRLIDEAMAQDGVVGVVALRMDDRRPAMITPDDFFHVGTVACIHRLLRLPDGTLRVAIQGIERFTIEAITQTEPYIRARIRMEPDVPAANTRETRIVIDGLIDLAADILEALPTPSDELQEQIAAEHDPRRLAYILAMTLLIRGTLAERQQLLELPDVLSKLRNLYRLLERERDAVRHHALYEDQAPQELAVSHHVPAPPAEMNDSWLARALTDAGMPPDVEQHAHQTLAHLLTLAADHPLVPQLHRAINWTLRLPWRIRSPQRTDLVERWQQHADACRELAEAHGSIAPLLATRQLRHQHTPASSQRLFVFIGPPGTGKHYLASLLSATYDAPLAHVLPGRNADEPTAVLRAIAQTEVGNPLLLYDETTITHSVNDVLALLGDPHERALFDPFLNLAWPYSPLAVILCVPSRADIPQSLVAHADIIELAGYSREEKRALLHRVLLPRAAADAGLRVGMLEIDDAAIEALLDADAAQPGIARLRTVLDQIAGAVALEYVVSAGAHLQKIGMAQIQQWQLVQPLPERNPAVGQSWAITGQHCFHITASARPGTGQMSLIGQRHAAFTSIAETVIAAITAVLSSAQQHDWAITIPIDAPPEHAAEMGLALTLACLSALTGTPCATEWAASGLCTPQGMLVSHIAGAHAYRTASRFRFTGLLLGATSAQPPSAAGIEIVSIAHVRDALRWLHAPSTAPTTG